MKVCRPRLASAQFGDCARASSRSTTLTRPQSNSQGTKPGVVDDHRLSVLVDDLLTIATRQAWCGSYRLRSSRCQAVTIAGSQGRANSRDSAMMRNRAYPSGETAVLAGATQRFAAIDIRHSN